MFRVQVHKSIKRTVSFFYRARVWHRVEEDTIREWRIKIFYSIYFGLYLLSLAIGAVTSDSRDEMVFLVQATIMIGVMVVKFVYLIW